MAKWDHINAQDIYPPELVREIQKYYSGGYLRIPKRGKMNRPRKQAKEDTHIQGASATAATSAGVL
jgi:hypothetical protein